MSSVLTRNGAVLVANGTAISYQGTEYVINATTPIYTSAFNLATVGLTVSDVVMDESTYFWIETTANVTISCGLDGNGDEDFNVTLPSGTKFTGIVDGTTQSGKTYKFSCVTSNTYGYFDAQDDDATTIGTGLGWFAENLDYSEPIGQTGDITNTNFALHIVKIYSSSSANLPRALGVSF